MNIKLVLFKENAPYKSFPLPSSITVIGRRRDCDLRLPLASVSRRHCKLSYDDNILKIRDLDSRNGTCLNGKRIEEAVVRSGDVIKIGPLMFKFQIDSQAGEVVKSDKTVQNPLTQDMDMLIDDLADDNLEDFTETDDSDSLLDDFDSL